MKNIMSRSDCPISFALDLFGDKWSLLIIRDLVFEEREFYKDFLSSPEGIATNILSDRLKKLENIGIIKSEIYEKLKTKKRYSLTKKGIDLIPILVEIIVWSSTYQKGLAVSSEFLNKLKANREKVINNLKANLNQKL
ncbi:MAG: helix-turn-helix transcriptional regulator [Flavobacteriales bacterium]|nr:helix-turn-helix transcriptional regulator [Flavobacteriales bacterium]